MNGETGALGCSLSSLTIIPLKAGFIMSRKTLAATLAAAGIIAFAMPAQAQSTIQSSYCPNGHVCFWQNHNYSGKSYQSQISAGRWNASEAGAELKNDDDSVKNRSAYGNKVAIYQYDYMAGFEMYCVAPGSSNNVLGWWVDNSGNSHQWTKYNSSDDSGCY